MLIETSYCPSFPRHRLMLLHAGRGMEESLCADNGCCCLRFSLFWYSLTYLKLALNSSGFDPQVLGLQVWHAARLSQTFRVHFTHPSGPSSFFLVKKAHGDFFLRRLKTVKSESCQNLYHVFHIVCSCQVPKTLFYAQSAPHTLSVQGQC